MPSNFLLHTSLLVVSIAGVYLWLTSVLLSPYSLQLVALLILVFATTHWRRSVVRAKPRVRNTIPLDLSLLTAAMLLLVSETGALASPVYFLLYFLLFAVAMLYEIEATLVLTGALAIYFLLLPGTDLTSLAHLSALLGLVLITPLALFTGHEYERLLESQKARAKLEGQIAKEETDTLIFLSTNLKSTLASSLERLNLLIPQTKVKVVREHLSLLYQDLKSLYRSASDLEKTLDRSSD